MLNHSFAYMAIAFKCDQKPMLVTQLTVRYAALTLLYNYLSLQSIIEAAGVAVRVCAVFTVSCV